MSCAQTPMSGQSSGPVASPDWKRSRVEDSLDGSDPEVEGGNMILDEEDLVETLEQELKIAKLGNVGCLNGYSGVVMAVAGVGELCL